MKAKRLAAVGALALAALSFAGPPAWSAGAGAGAGSSEPVYEIGGGTHHTKRATSKRGKTKRVKKPRRHRAKSKPHHHRRHHRAKKPG